MDRLQRTRTAGVEEQYVRVHATTRSPRRAALKAPSIRTVPFVVSGGVCTSDADADRDTRQPAGANREDDECAPWY